MRHAIRTAWLTNKFTDCDCRTRQKSFAGPVIPSSYFHIYPDRLKTSGRHHLLAALGSSSGDESKQPANGLVSARNSALRIIPELAALSNFPM